MLHYESPIVIVGGGPAGLATAYTLRQAGLEFPIGGRQDGRRSFLVHAKESSIRVNRTV